MTLPPLTAKKKGTILGKGVVNNRMSNLLMQMLEENGVPTHFVKELSERETVVKKVSIVPLEVIIRNIAAGSFSKRFGVEEGTALKTPSLEYSYKDDALGDPMINDYHILSLGLATKEELATIAGYAFKVNELLKAFMLKPDIELVDFKLELARRRTARLYWPTKFLLIPAVFGMCIPMRSWIRIVSAATWAEKPKRIRRSCAA